MNESKFAQQLVGELPSLVSRNIINAPSAETLRQHYEPQIKPSRAASIGLTISAILGGLLVGAGIILLIAHNWDELSKPLRAFLAMLPLAISAALAGYTILRRMDSAAWREGCGVFYFLSIGASIALVSQTYHLYNDMAGFLFVWTLLTLPVIYLLNSGAMFAGYLACLAAYALALDGNNYWIAQFLPKPFALLALAMPFYVWHAWKRRESLTVVWLSWALAVALPFMVWMFVDRADAVFVWTAYGLLGVVYYLAGRRWFGAHRGFGNPFRTLGSLGIAIVAVAFTYEHAHELESWNRMPLAAAGWHAAIAALAWLALAADLLRRKMDFNIVVALFPVLLALGIFFPENDAVLLLANAYVLALGVFTLVRGVRRDSLFSMNEGTILIAALVVCRFFNDDYSFVARGVAFILAGCGFLAMNLLVMSRRRKQKEQGRKGGAS